MTSLKAQTISGMLWTLIQNGGSRVISFLVFIFLARLLSPEAYGLIGMLAIFISVSQTLLQSGFGQALVQKKETDEEDFSSIFWINLAVSLLLYGILFFAAPLIAKFYDQPILIDLTRGLSLIFIFNAFSLVPAAKLTKTMQFKKLAIISLPSSIIGGCVGIGMALMNFGVWSLVGLRLATDLSKAVQLWWYSRWKPLFTFNTAKAKRLFSFGGNLMLASIIFQIFNNAYLVVIGKFFPVTYVGYYNTSLKFIMLPAQAISVSVSKVTFPAFSSIQEDKARLIGGVRKTVQQGLFWLFPAFVLAGVLAEPLFSVVLTNKWLPAVPFFQILCVIGALNPLNATFNNVINAKGRSDLYLKKSLIVKSVAAVGIVIGIFMGIWALVVSQAITTIIGTLVNSYLVARVSGYTITKQFKDLSPMVFIGLLVGIVVYFLNTFILSFNDWFRLVLGFGVGAGLYLLLASWRKLEPYLEFLGIFKGKFSKKT